jgi:hypothetical protein
MTLGADFLRAHYATGRTKELLLREAKAKLDAAARTPQIGERGAAMRLLNAANAKSRITKG